MTTRTQTPSAGRTPQDGPAPFPSVVRIAELVGRSVLRFVPLVVSGCLQLRHDRLGQRYDIDDRGTYKIFGETAGHAGTPDDCVVLVVGFRLRFLGSNPVLHSVFQRACILSTPFWSGFQGFRHKLWMVGQSMDYLGIYEWAGEDNAQVYVGALVRVLRASSTPGSVWYELHPHQELASYLQSRRH